VANAIGVAFGAITARRAKLHLHAFIITLGTSLIAWARTTSTSILALRHRAGAFDLVRSFLNKAAAT
jgi:ribose/xylose/arabinose/galactoside ABC-type transport system permease subunit